MKVGIIGCGNISGIYLENGRDRFPEMEIVAVADLDRQRAEAQAKAYGVDRVLSPEDLLGDSDIEAVLNLTIPAVHGEVNTRILQSGKHAYSEKPFALDLKDAREVVALAAKRGLRVGSAPDTFLGGGLQLCRRLIDQGAIGRPLSANAAMLCHGHESWHPSPAFYYAKGGGPMLDMGPYYLTALISLLGPIASVSANTDRGYEQRIVTSQPHHGDAIPVEVNTHLSGTLRFLSGTIATVTMSFDVWKSRQPLLEVHGSEGSLACPDPNTFGGPIYLSRRGGEWEELPVDQENHTENSRGLGLADMIRAINEQRPHRASGELALHVLETMLAFDQSSDLGKAIAIESDSPYLEALEKSE